MCFQDFHLKENRNDLDDCGEWPAKITDDIRQVLVEKGPVQVKHFKFPVDHKSGRRFTVANYKQKLSNGEEIDREWLVYSKSKNSVFCFFCKLFSNEVISVSGREGYSDWQNMSTFLRQHEKSPHHIKAAISYRELSQRLKSGKTIDDENQRIIKSETEHWYEVLKRLLTIVQFLGAQGLAFRGTNDKIFQENNGNFLKLVEHISRFDAVLSEHLRRITSKETHVHYLSKEIQNEFIDVLARKVNEFILSELHKATYYSIILDCTPDVSHQEQMTLVVRFVHAIPGENAIIKEYFLGFLQAFDTSGEGLTALLLDELSKRGIALNNMRGQGYDNGSNMKGKHVGVQKRILDLNPRAFFVPCGSHSLNLVVNDAALSCTVAVNFFSNVQEIYNYFSASIHRWDILKHHVTNLTVKPLSETRWESRIDALEPLRYHIDEIYDAVYAASTDAKIDVFGRNTATGIAKKITDFRFLCCLITWYEVLFKINLVSKTLQAKEVNLNSAMTLIESVKSFLIKMRTENGFNNVVTDAKELADKLGISSEFPNETVVRARIKVKRQFLYEGVDEPIKTGKDAFKINFFFVILDTAFSSLSERFDLMHNHSQHFQFLYDLKKLENDEEKTIKGNCQRLSEVLTAGDERDINAEDLFKEISILIPMLSQEESSPHTTLSYLTTNRLIDIFPNVFIALRILLTLPISVASGERSFSKLKRIKNYLRSSISQERLSGLATLAIENEILNTIDTDTILKDFAKATSRKKGFLK